MVHCYVFVDWFVPNERVITFSHLQHIALPNFVQSSVGDSLLNKNKMLLSLIEKKDCKMSRGKAEFLNDHLFNGSFKPE